MIKQTHGTTPALDMDIGATQTLLLAGRFGYFQNNRPISFFQWKSFSIPFQLGQQMRICNFI
jgi:hypothetical protein